MRSKYIDFFRKAFYPQKETPNTPSDISRRNFIKTASTLGLGVLAGGAYTACNNNPTPPSIKNPKAKKNWRIAIIGAGISGLSTAYFLQKNNIDCSVFEASSRVGGRMLSIKDWAGKEITTDLGAEFVCEYHHDLIALAKEVNIDLYDLRKDPLFDLPPSFFVEGKERTFKDFVAGLQPAVKSINKDLESLHFDFTYKNVPERVKTLDKLSITQYLDQFKLESWVKKLLEVVFEAEYGMDANEQSCLNMLCVLKLPEQNDKTFEILGKDYEVLKIKGGTQALAEGVYKPIKKQVFFNHVLTGYDINSKGKYELTFNNNVERNQIKTFDYIVFTMPFKILRKIKTNVVYPPHKKEAIDNMGYANNCKTIFNFKNPVWRNKKKSGLFFTDLLAQCGWDSSAEQRLLERNAATITFFYGGKKAKIFNDLPQKETLEVSAIIINKNLNFDFNKYYDQKITEMLWENYPYAQCSYTAFRIGEWTKYTGVPQETFKNIFFAGEHCNIEYQGFMNGAIQSAKATAQNILTTINKT